MGQTVMQFQEIKSKTFFWLCCVSLGFEVKSVLMRCSKRSRFLPSEKHSVHCCEYLITYCHETVISADAQRTVTKEMVEDFLV